MLRTKHIQWTILLVILLTFSLPVLGQEKKSEQDETPMPAITSIEKAGGKAVVLPGRTPVAVKSPRKKPKGGKKA